MISGQLGHLDGLAGWFMIRQVPAWFRHGMIWVQHD